MQPIGSRHVWRLRESKQVRILETGGHPLVYGEWLHAPGKPTVLIYGHFDTQPVDPLEQWTHPPFEPWIEDGRIYAPWRDRRQRQYARSDPCRRSAARS